MTAGDPEAHGHTSACSYKTVSTLRLLPPLMPVTDASVAPFPELSPHLLSFLMGLCISKAKVSEDFSIKGQKEKENKTFWLLGEWPHALRSQTQGAGVGESTSRISCGVLARIFSFWFPEVQVQLGTLNFYLLNLGDLIAGHSLGHMVSFVLFTNL